MIDSLEEGSYSNDDEPQGPEDDNNNTHNRRVQCCASGEAEISRAILSSRDRRQEQSGGGFVFAKGIGGTMFAEEPRMEAVHGLCCDVPVLMDPEMVVDEDRGEERERPRFSLPCD